MKCLPNVYNLLIMYNGKIMSTLQLNRLFEQELMVNVDEFNIDDTRKYQKKQFGTFGNNRYFTYNIDDGN